MMMTISVASPIASPLRGSKSGKPSPTKPMPLCGLRNRTGNEGPWFGVRSRRRLAVSRSHPYRRYRRDPCSRRA